jgi:glycosyltransferase involved in cell wall biosynthesis
LTSKAESLAPITIAHVVERFSGGVATFVKLLAETQSKDGRFAAVHVLADMRFSANHQDVGGVIVHAYESSREPWRIIGVANGINRILREIRPDIVIAHSSFPGFYTRYGRHCWPIIYCAHGWSFSQSKNPVKKLLYKKMEQFLASRTDAIVNVCAFEREQAIRAGIPNEIQHTILNGIPDAPIETQLRFVVDSTDINLGFIGRIDAKKGVDRLLRACGGSELKGLKLWIIGGGADAAAPKVAGAMPNVRFIDWIPNHEIDSHIRQLDAVIVPSRWEACSLVVLEAMRAGRAVIATRVGGLPELVREGDTGLFIDVDDVESARATLQSLTKENLRRLGLQGRRTFESKFTWLQCYRGWDTTIKLILRRSDRKFL